MIKTRFAWSYKTRTSDGDVFLAVFSSPSHDAPKLDIPTPYRYVLTRNEVSYVLCSTHQLTREKAVEIAGKLYEDEFVLAPDRLKKMPVVNRRK